MKRLNKISGVALLRGVTFLSGIMATMCFASFMESWNTLFAVVVIGVTVTTIMDEQIKSLVR